MTDFERLINLIKPYMSAEPCKHETGSCGLTSCSKCRAWDIAEDLLKNGVMFPPIKVGDLVYYIDGGHYKSPENCKVSKPCKVVEISYKMQRKSNTNRILEGFIIENGTRYSFDGIGKTVFLSYEDAIKEMEHRRNKA